MTRIPSGITDQGFYFVAVSTLDGQTRVTGLSAFTVARSRNGAADAAMTTPTVTEIDASTMPGVYFLLCDEDMTLTAGDETEEMAYHITASGMMPVTQVVELFDESAWIVENSLSLKGILRLLAADNLGKASGMATTTATFRDTADTKDRIVATVDTDGNRTAVTLDAS